MDDAVGSPIEPTTSVPSATFEYTVGGFAGSLPFYVDGLGQVSGALFGTSNSGMWLWLCAGTRRLRCFAGRNIYTVL